jgi:hypothetical protein
MYVRYSNCRCKNEEEEIIADINGGVLMSQAGALSLL